MDLCLNLQISLDFLELQGAQQSDEASSLDKDEVSALKAGLRKVKFITEYVSTRRPRKEEEGSSEGRYFSKSEDDEYAYACELDSTDEFEEGECNEVKEDYAARTSFSYGTLAYANHAGVLFYSNATNHEGEDWIYYSNRRRSDAGCPPVEDPLSSAPEQPLMQNSKRSILPWRKRKLSFRSPKVKGEPLLKKANGEEGGDDIDFDRRQLSSDESLSPKVTNLVRLINIYAILCSFFIYISNRCCSGMERMGIPMQISHHCLNLVTTVLQLEYGRREK